MEGDHGTPPPNGWSGLRALARLKRLNAECIARLADVAQTEIDPIERSPIYREWELWKRVDKRACDRAARCPVLLLNLHFERFDWWKRACGGTVIVRHGTPQPLLSREGQSQSLLREILMEVWRLGRSLPNATTLLFGLAPGVCAEIANLSAMEVDRIAVDYARNLRPRWEENAVFWKKLLESAVDIDDETSFNVHLHCLQLLGSELELHGS